MKALVYRMIRIHVHAGHTTSVMLKYASHTGGSTEILSRTTLIHISMCQVGIVENIYI